MYVAMVAKFDMEIAAPVGTNVRAAAISLSPRDESITADHLASMLDVLIYLSRRSKADKNSVYMLGLIFVTHDYITITQFPTTTQVP